MIPKKNTICLFIIILFCFSCNKQEKSEPAKEELSMTANYVRINNQGDLASLHPHTGIDLPCRIFQKALFEGLTRLDEHDHPQLAIAERYELSEDHLSYKFHLRHSIWNNGEPLTAHHFRESWLNAIKPDSSCLRADLFYIIKNVKKIKSGELLQEDFGVSVIDDSTLLITLEHPAPYFLELLANPLYSPLYDQAEEPVVCNGPFMIDFYDHTRKLILKKNPHYWDKEHVFLEKIETSFVPDPSTAVMMYEKNELDWVGAPFTMLPTDFIKHAEKSKEFVSKPIAAVYSYSCNIDQVPLNSKKVRQALSIALHREDLCHHVLLGESPTRTLLPPNITHLREEDLYEDHNLDMARMLFKEGLEELELTKEELPPLEISYSDIPGQKQLAMALQQIWQEAFDVTVNVTYSDWNTFFSRLTSRQFHLAGCVWFTAYQDATYNLDSFLDKEDRYNLVGWEHPEFARYIESANHESNYALRSEYLRRAELLLMEEMPMIPIYIYHSKYLVSDRIKGIRFSSMGHVDFKGMYLD